jgi:hypothetical protein
LSSRPSIEARHRNPTRHIIHRVQLRKPAPSQDQLEQPKDVFPSLSLKRILLQWLPYILLNLIVVLCMKASSKGSPRMVTLPSPPEMSLLGNDRTKYALMPSYNCFNDELEKYALMPFESSDFCEPVVLKIPPLWPTLDRAIGISCDWVHSLLQ